MCWDSAVLEVTCLLGCPRVNRNLWISYCFRSAFVRFYVLYPTNVFQFSLISVQGPHHFWSSDSRTHYFSLLPSWELSLCPSASPSLRLIMRELITMWDRPTSFAVCISVDGVCLPNIDKSAWLKLKIWGRRGRYVPPCVFLKSSLPADFQKTYT